MAKENPTTKHLEVITYHHKGISVMVEVNYDEGTISLVDKNPAINRGYVKTQDAKKWIFAGRQIEYMAGWQNILDAMKYAIEQATEALEKHQKEAEKRLLQKRIDLENAIDEMQPSKEVLKKGYKGKFIIK